MEDFGKVFGRGDMVVLDRKVVGRVNLDQPSKAFAELCALSDRSQALYIIPLRCFDKGECSNSVCVIDSGRVLCLQDEINAKCGYVSRNRIFLVDTSVGKIGLVIDSDILYVDIWSRYVGKGLRYIVCCNHCNCQSPMLVMLQSISLSVGCVVVGSWNDQSVVASGGHITDIAVGKLRPLWINHSANSGYVSHNQVELCSASLPTKIVKLCQQNLPFDIL